MVILVGQSMIAICSFPDYPIYVMVSQFLITMRGNPGMPGKVEFLKQRKWLVLIIVLLLIHALVVVKLAAPVIIESKVLPSFAGKLGFTKSAGEVRALGLTRLDLGMMKFGDHPEPILQIDSIQVNYSLFSLLRRRIKQVSISGIELRAIIKDGQLIIPELDLNDFCKKPSGTQSGEEVAEAAPAGRIPWLPDRFLIRHAVIRLRWQGKDFRLPFSVLMETGKNGKSKLDVRLFPRSQELHLAAQLQPGMKLQTLKVNIADLDFSRFTDLAPNFPELRFRGNLDLNTDIKLPEEQFGVDLACRGMALAWGEKFELRNSQLEDGTELPIQIKVRRHGGQLNIQANRFRLLAPVPLEISLENAPVKVDLMKPGRFDFRLAGGWMRLDKDLLRQKFRFPLELKKSPIMNFKLKGSVDKAGGWNFTVNPELTEKEILLAGKAGLLIAQMANLQLRGKGQGEIGSVKYGVRAQSIKFFGTKFQVECPELEVFGNFNRSREGKLSLKSFANYQAANLFFGQFRAGEINGSIPLQWPFPREKTRKIKDNKAELGNCRVGYLAFKEMKLGEIDATLSQDGPGFIIVGQHQGIFPEMVTDFSGTAGMESGIGPVVKFSFNLPEKEGGYRLPLRHLQPKFGGAELRGKLSGSGSVWFQPGVKQSKFKGRLSQGEFLFPDKSLVVKGLETELDIPELLKFRSAPQQEMNFSEIRLGKIALGTGKLAYQFESPRMLFLEKSSFSWCSGHVYSHAFRMDPGKREIDIILFCDRVNLAQVLRQFNVARAEGEGTVSGRIPLLYRNGKITMSDGFLYSSPGQGGVIRMKNTEILTAGARAGLQLAITRESLKNYQYDWAKLMLNSDQDEMLLQIELDGKPANLLPFGFTLDRGLFLASDESAYRANFQGIGFAFNIRMPLNQLLEEGQGVKDILDEVSSELNKMAK